MLNGNTYSYPAKCGFGQQGKVFCNQQLSGKYFQDFLTKYKAAFASGTLNCHVDSDHWVSGFDCADLLNRLGQTTSQTIKSLTYLHEAGFFGQFASLGTYLVQDNDQCVKDTVSFLYYGGSGNKDFAGRLAAGISALLLLFW